MWVYYGINVYPADISGSGIRWYSVVPHLRADTKDGMRALIRHHLGK